MATALDLTVLEVTGPGGIILPGSTATLAEVTAPPPDANGNGNNQQSITVGAGPVDEAVFTARVQRTTSALISTSEVADGFSLDLFGTTGVVAADEVTSTSTCPIPEVGVPSSSTSVTGLTIDGAPATVGDTDVIVPIDGGVGAGEDSAELRVSVTQPQAADATSASATGLQVNVDLVVDFATDLDDIDVNIINLALADTACTQPAGIAPTGATIDPGSGPDSTPVTITGTGFIPGDTTVDFGGTTIPATDTTVSADGTTVDFAVPDNSPLGATTVTASTPVGTTGPLGFTVTASPPTAAAINPDQGPQGTTVTITGTEFQPGATTVAFGAATIPASDVTVAPDGTSLTFAVPAGSPLGATTVTATTAGGTTGPLGFTVTALPAPPTASAIDPDSGPEGTTVTVTGTDFVPSGTTVSFGDITIPATQVAVAPDGTSLTFTVPAGSPVGPTDVVASTPAGSTGTLGFLVTADDAPTAGGISPGAGPVGTTVTVDGTNFVPGATTVRFGDLTIPPADVAVSGDGTQLTFTVPLGAPLGTTTVTAETPNGTTGPLAYTVTSNGGAGAGTNTGSGNDTNNGNGNGLRPAQAVTPRGTLPFTGTNIPTLLGFAGLLLLAVGATAVTTVHLARTRRRAL